MQQIEHSALNGNGVEQRARQMRLAGVLFIAGALFGVPSTLILAEVDPGQVLPFTALGVLSGIVCLLFPWERLSPGWIHAAIVSAIVEVGAIAIVIDSSFLLYFVIIGVFVSYIFESRRGVGLYIGLISLVVAGYAVAFAGDDGAVQLAMLTLPTVLVSAIMVAYLRESLEASRLKYQRFAEEALELAARLRGEAAAKVRAEGNVEDELEHPEAVEMPLEPETTRGLPPVRRIGLALAAALLAIPLGLASLAAAGVRLPGIATAPFEEVGIPLPNQDEAESNGLDPRALAGEVPEHTVRADGDDQNQPADEGGSGAGSESGDSAAAASGAGSDASQEPAAPYSRGPAAQQRPTGDPPTGDPVPNAPSRDSLDRALRDTLDLLHGTLPLKQQAG